MRIDPPPYGEQAEAPDAAHGRPPAQLTPPTEATGLPPEAKPSIREASLPMERELAVSVQWEQGQIMILRFTDIATGNLIQQIPSEEVVSVFRAIQEMLRDEAAATQIEADL